MDVSKKDTEKLLKHLNCIIEPPVFTVVPPPELHVNVGTNVTLACDGSGRPQPQVHWRHSCCFRHRRYTNEYHHRGDIFASPLHLGEITYDQHNHTYECVIGNSVAIIRRTVRLIVENTRPHPPHSLRLDSTVSSTRLRFSWQPGYDGGHVQRFRVRYRPILGQWITVDRLFNNTELFIDDLRPNGDYEFVVDAINDVGIASSDTMKTRYLIG